MYPKSSDFYFIYPFKLCEKQEVINVPSLNKRTLAKDADAFSGFPSQLKKEYGARAELNLKLVNTGEKITVTNYLTFIRYNYPEQ